MTTKRIRSMLSELFCPVCSPGRKLEIHAMLGHAIRKNGQAEDVLSYEILLDKILIETGLGRLRSPREIWAAFPVIVMLCSCDGREDRGLRLADWPKE